MQYTRFGNFVANPSTNLSARQSFAVESDLDTRPFLTVRAIPLIGVGLFLLAYLWSRK